MFKLYLTALVTALLLTSCGSEESNPVQGTPTSPRQEAPQGDATAIDPFLEPSFKEISKAITTVAQEATEDRITLDQARLLESTLSQVYYSDQLLPEDAFTVSARVKVDPKTEDQRQGLEAVLGCGKTSFLKSIRVWLFNDGNEESPLMKLDLISDNRNERIQMKYPARASFLKPSIERDQFLQFEPSLNASILKKKALFPLGFYVRMDNYRISTSERQDWIAMVELKYLPDAQEKRLREYLAIVEEGIRLTDDAIINEKLDLQPFIELQEKLVGLNI